MKFSRAFGINKSQSELDFVDIDLHKDTPLYIDPYALTTKDDEWSQHCHSLVVSYFEQILASVKNDNKHLAARLLSHLSEPEETHLGVSKGGKGRGIGAIQAQELFEAMKRSPAAKTGLLEDLSDFALFIPLVARDKISDMTTNLIRLPLVEYTLSQCVIYDIPVRRVPSSFYWDIENLNWGQCYVDLPVYENKPILLVPKFAVRWEVGVDHQKFRRDFVLEFLQGEHLRADDALVTTLVNKKGKVTGKKVYKSTLDAHYPKGKEFLAQFSVAHPEVLDKYRDALKLASSSIPNIGDSVVNQEEIATELELKLAAIAAGSDSATEYHRHMIGVISFLFFPNLVYPRVEAEINEGRKRIDILFTNGKLSGLFYRLAFDQYIKANFVHVECKNYTKDVANPEIDQIIGRFDQNRGRLGMMLYRSAANQQRVIERCRDAAKAGQGIILPFDDAFIVKCLRHVVARTKHKIDEEINVLYEAVVT